MTEIINGHQGFLFLSEKNTIVTKDVYYRYHRLVRRWRDMFDELQRSSSDKTTAKNA